MGFSKKQQDIINTKENTLVVANPGTGKTTTLSYKVIKLLENGTSPENILCITFTEKAKKEMFDAIMKNAKDKLLLNADIMKISIHTFHSFAYNYLRDQGKISGDIVGNNNLRFSILKSFEQNNALNYEKNYIITEIVPKTENAIRYIKSWGIKPDKINIKKTEGIIEKIFDEKSSTYTMQEMRMFLRYFVKAYEEYETSKLDAVDYSDMLLVFKDEFGGAKFEHVLVDEMQDMNEIEADIAQMVAENLFLVGDSKQAIFGFQGGSVNNFDRFEKTCTKKQLTENYRSTQQILNYATKYFLENIENRDKFKEELEGFQSDMTGDMPQVISSNNSTMKVLDLIKENPNKTIGIITRTNKQIIEISKVLDANGITYTSTSSRVTTQRAKEEIQTYLKGLLSDSIEDKIRGTFTVFSRYSLQEAFGFSREYDAKRRDGAAASDSIKLGAELTREDMDRVFDCIILPVCVSKGAEWFTTAISLKQEVDEYLTFEMPTLEGLLDFIVIGEESRMERRSDSQITLTTVHKAKGREFDVAVYIPVTPKKKTSFINTIVESILLSRQIDVKDEVEDESLRVDFVAFTRAKEKLVVIVDGNKNSKQNYHVEGFSDMEVDDRSNNEPAGIVMNSSTKLSKAYSLFVQGMDSDAKELLQHKNLWLKQYVKDYFAKIDRLSYSGIKTDAYEFMLDNIVNMPHSSSGTKLGSRVHKAIQEVFTNKTRLEDYDDDKVRKAVQNALDAVDRLRGDLPGLKLIATEKYQKIPLGSMTSYSDDDNLLFTGYMDAVFKHDQGYLIVDYKTDKKLTRKSEHTRQLAVYKRMLSIAEEIPEEKISTCVIFVALRDGINTGRFDMALIEEGKRASYPKFEERLQKVLEWRRNPETFIDELLTNEKDELLYQKIKDELTNL